MKCKTLDSFPDGKVCCLCQSRDVDVYRLGLIYTIKIKGDRLGDETFTDLTVHYFCLLFSSKLRQKGNDKQGICGFLPKDIYKEIVRGRTVSCTYCKKMGATVNCCIDNCNVQFHLSCGTANQSMLSYNQFKSYCERHRVKQIIPKKIKSDIAKTETSCILCFHTISLKDKANYIWPTCCKPTALLHRFCLQRMALSSGYYFKCPFCSNKDKFCESMREKGIFIPNQDASWEQEPNAYDGLNNSLKCEADKCFCPRGREFKRKRTRWHLIPCTLCGGSSIHSFCANLWSGRKIRHTTLEWNCETCMEIAGNREENQTTQTKVSNIYEVDVEKDYSDDECLIMECEEEEFQIHEKTDSIEQTQIEPEMSEQEPFYTVPDVPLVTNVQENTETQNILREVKNVLCVREIIPHQFINPNMISNKIIIIESGQGIDISDFQQPYIDPDIIVID